MPSTSFRLDPDTQEILRILGIPFVQVFRKGLVAYGIEGRIRDPRVQLMIRKYHQDLLEKMDAERLVLESLIMAFENGKSDVQMAPRNEIQEIIERPEGLGTAMAEMMKTDETVPRNFIRNLIIDHIKDLSKYDGNLKVLIVDLDGLNLDNVERVALNIISGRKDLEKIVESGLHMAIRERGG